MTKNVVVKELHRFVKNAVYHIGGSGGRMQCRYCLCERYETDNKSQHYRTVASGGEPNEAYQDCEVTVMREAIRLLTS